MFLTQYDILNLQILQSTQRPAGKVFAGIRCQYYFAFDAPDHKDCVCGVDGALLDIREHHTDSKRFFIDYAVLTSIEGFSVAVENVEIVRVYTNMKDIERNFGYIFAQADKAEVILESCNLKDDEYLFLEKPKVTNSKLFKTL